jgi:hypothetical protein
MEDHLQGQLSTRGAFATLGILLLVAACAKDAPPPPADVQPLARIELDSGRTVEIIGLRRWTAEMVRDSLRKYAPDEGLESDATAANLRNLLGFADAATSIHTVVFDEDEKATITIAVREPGDSARVHYAPQALDSVASRPEWRALTTSVMGDSTGRLVPIVAAAHLDGLSRLVVDSTMRGRKFTHREGYAFESPADSLAAMPILDSIGRRRSPADFDAAVETIATSTSGPDRAAAVLILANFPDRDEAWRSLFKAAIGLEQARDAFIAQQALVSLSERAPRAVDWSPVAPAIHDVLDGTALATLAPLATALVATGVSTAQAVPYLANGGEMLTAYVESDNPDIRDSAHDLLVRLRGQDLGFEPGPWRDWIRTLGSANPGKP